MDLKMTDGPTGFAGQRLLDGIRVFQKQHGLSVDGRLNPGGPTLKALSQSLQSMGRNGDTVLAHLTPAEAQVLHAITDGGSINPKTGLLEFWTGNPGDRDNANANPGFAGPSGSNNADTVGEKMKEMHNAREAAMAAASPTPSPNNADTVGEKMKKMHNAREARLAAAPDKDDLEPFGGRGADIPADKSNIEKALARKALQLEEEQKAARNPRFKRSYRNLLEDVDKRQALKTPPPPSELDKKQTHPNISEQVQNIKELEKRKPAPTTSKPYDDAILRQARKTPGHNTAAKPSQNTPGNLELALDFNETALRVGAVLGELFGLEKSAKFLEHFLDGSGEEITVPRDEARKDSFIADAEKENQQSFENKTFLGRTDDNAELNDAMRSLKDGEDYTDKDHWDQDMSGNAVLRSAAGNFGSGGVDSALSFGQQKFTSTSEFTATRKGDTIDIEGIVTHDGSEDYDFHDGRSGDALGAKDLQDAGMGTKFNINRQWQQRFTGTVKVLNDIKGELTLGKPEFTWQDVD
jgi:hypothetical protein